MVEGVGPGHPLLKEEAHGACEFLAGLRFQEHILDNTLKAELPFGPLSSGLFGLLPNFLDYCVKCTKGSFAVKIVKRAPDLSA